MLIGDESHTINAILSKRTVDKCKSQRSPFQLQTGDILQLEKIEIRITDCFDPPQLELWIGSFDIIAENENKAQNCTRNQVEEQPDIKSYLSQYKAQFEQKMARSDDDCSMISQVC